VSRKSSRSAGLDFRGSSKNYKNRRFFIFRENSEEGEESKSLRGRRGTRDDWFSDFICFIKQNNYVINHGINHVINHVIKFMFSQCLPASQQHCNTVLLHYNYSLPQSFPLPVREVWLTPNVLKFQIFRMFYYGKQQKIRTITKSPFFNMNNSFYLKIHIFIFLKHTRHKYGTSNK